MAVDLGERCFCTGGAIVVANDFGEWSSGRVCRRSTVSHPGQRSFNCGVVDPSRLVHVSERRFHLHVSRAVAMMLDVYMYKWNVDVFIALHLVIVRR